MTSSAGGLPPEPVKARVAALAARALGAMPAAQIPPPLRKAASFAPAKRARLLGDALVSRLASDDAFREQLGVQARALEPALAAALDDGAAIPPAELVEAAALAFVLRTDGWERVLAEATAGAASAAPPADWEDRAARMAAAVDTAKGELKAAREKHRAQLDALKAENAQLRRTLGQTRVELREAQDDAARARAEVEAGERRRAESTRALEADVRRLRARVDELASDTAAARRAARDDRAAEAARLRLLLDTLADAAAGLRRELALPPGEVLPADTVDSLEPGGGSAVVDAGRSMPDDDPLLLRRLVEVPRVHLIVDGYNVSKEAWPTLPLDQQRSRLVSGLSALVAGTSAETTVVFDGADLVNPPPVVSPRGVRVRFSPPRVIADDLIRQLVEAEPVGRPIVVVSTDREVARSARKKGARAVASAALVGLIAG